MGTFPSKCAPLKISGKTEIAETLFPLIENYYDSEPHAAEVRHEKQGL